MAHTIIQRQQVLSPDSGISYEFNFIPSEFARRCLLYRTSTGHMYPNSKYLVDRRRFDSYLIMYVLFGQLSCQTTDNIYLVNEGEAVLINCYSPHLYRATTDSDFYWTHFDGNGSSRIFSNISPDDNACVFRDDKAYKIAQFLTLSFYNAPVIDMTETEYSTQLYSLLMGLIDPIYEKKKADRKFMSDFVNSIDYYIHQNYKNDITLSDIARFAEVSESQLSKEYKKMTGISPYAALVKYRISVACKLLRTTNMAISEIAESTGYNSLANFTYGFSKEVGMSPSDYRSQNSVVF